MNNTESGYPTVDVVIPNYNYGQYLLECAASVLTQKGVDVRLLIIDNASHDLSADICRTIAAGDQRVEVVLRTRNLGPHASFNEGIDWARSEYFLILCADDLLVDGALSRAVCALEQSPDVHLAHGSIENLSGNDYPKPVDLPKRGGWVIQSGNEFIERACMHAYNPVAGPTALVRTSVQKKVGYYKTNLQHTDDLEMWLRFATYGGVASTNAVQACARVHNLNRSASVAGIVEWNCEFEAAFRTFFESDGAALPNASALFELAQDCLAKRAYWSAFSNLLRREKGSASLMAFALRRHPSMILFPPIDYLLQRRNRH